MSGWEIVSHAVTISGRVVDSLTNKGIGQAMVTIINGPTEFLQRLILQSRAHGLRRQKMNERTDRCQTAPDGHFYFMDLPVGEYTLTALLPGLGSRYGSGSTTASVSLDSMGETLLTLAEIALTPTSLTGRVTDQVSGHPVPMARIAVRGSNEQTFSTKSGDYRIAGLETGPREIHISAPGFTSVIQSVSLDTPGAVVTQDVVLSAS